MPKHTQGIQTPAQILEGLNEVFGRRAANCPVMKPDEQIDALKGVVANIARLAADHPELADDCKDSLRHCADNPVLQQEKMQPVVAAIRARLQPAL